MSTFDQTPREGRPVLEIVPTATRRGLFRRLGGARPDARGSAGPEEGIELFAVSRGDDGGPRLKKWPAEGGRSAPAASSLAQVRTEARPLHCPLAGALTDAASNRWDVVFEGTWSVTDPEGFLVGYGLGSASAGAPLAAETVASWMVGLMRPQVTDAVRSYGIEDLRDEAALPISWWEKRLTEWLGTYGITIRLSDVRWESADAERAGLELRRAKDLDRLQQERERAREAELREADAEAKYEQERERLEADRAISAEEKGHGLQLLEERHRKEMLEARAEVEHARWAYERASLEHEVSMARLRRDLAAAEQVQAREEEATRQHDTMSEQLAAATELLQRITSLGDPLLTQLADAEPRTAHQAAERLTSPEFSMPAEQLSLLGYEVSAQTFVAALRDEVAPRGAPMDLRMVQLRTRDIGTTRVSALPMNSSLQFEFEPPRSGYVTLINIGTSGAIWLQVPNPFVAPAAAQVTAGRSYHVPGPELLPWDRIGGYYENGPAGWEHMVVAITVRPLVDPEVIAGAGPNSPFAQLDADDVAGIAATLNAMPEDEYALGVLSFLVE